MAGHELALVALLPLVPLLLPGQYKTRGLRLAPILVSHSVVDTQRAHSYYLKSTSMENVLDVNIRAMLILLKFTPLWGEFDLNLVNPKF